MVVHDRCHSRMMATEWDNRPTEGSARPNEWNDLPNRMERPAQLNGASVKYGLRGDGDGARGNLLILPPVPVPAAAL